MTQPATFPIQLAGQQLLLHPFHCAFWVEAQTLLLADLHLGKAHHFRRAGLAVPLAVADANLDKLTSVIWDFQPRRVLFLGDLFHSVYNRQWAEFCGVLEQFPNIAFELVIGNHDILDPSFYLQAGLKLHLDRLVEGPFLFSHHPLEEPPSAPLYPLAGHLHPAVRLLGAGRQRLTLACFFFGKMQGLLPAFGEFTGLSVQSCGPEDRVYVIAGEEILEVNRGVADS